MAGHSEIWNVNSDKVEIPHEKGVESTSELYQVTPSPRARRVLYYLEELGHFRCSNQYAVEHGVNNAFSIFTITEGSMKVRMAGKEKILCAGDFGFINKKEEYKFQALETLDYVWLHLDGANTEAFFDEIRSSIGFALRPAHSIYIQEQMFRLLDQMRNMGRMEEINTSRCLYDLMCSLLYSNQLKETRMPQIAAVQKYLSEHLNEELSAEELANRFHMSISQLNRRFRESTGQSPHEYLVQLRIDRSKILLRESRRSIADIAGEVGYAYDTSFAAAFRSKVGVSPRRYRNMFK